MLPPRLLPYSPRRDVYRLLGVAPSASTGEALEACRHLARRFHPDRNVSARATEEMQVVNAVRSVMSHPELRAEYDAARRRWLEAAVQPPTVARSARPTLSLTTSRRTSPAERYARATLAGVRACLTALVPPRCERCWLVVAPADAYCVSCGTPLLDSAA